MYVSAQLPDFFCFAQFQPLAGLGLVPGFFDLDKISHLWSGNLSVPLISGWALCNRLELFK